ncbi:MAG TPA: 4-(cytidine 5'-diphospho)-2-C-methyl-D-erythritol kinase [Flavisolibacter sp.]|nr:4-(cytidine 5'-diphospho)-2-C-methyl-D-erythritol kinase [Flavisolibacter sp.]
MITFPNCKINLGLHITAKRNDGYHDIETIFYPVQLCDGLEVIKNQVSAVTELSLSGLFIDSPTPDNICYKAYSLLKSDFPDLAPLQIHLHKVIPTGAGLGGGSSNGAYTLSLINHKFKLGLDEQTLMKYALQLGSDCPFFILNKSAYATGRGEKLEPLSLDLNNYSIVLINPGIHINTGWAFSRITPGLPLKLLKEIVARPVPTWKDSLTNDFEVPVFQEYPAIKELKELLYNKGAVYASMTGSGSTVFGLFEKPLSLQLDLPSPYFMKTI